MAGGALIAFSTVMSTRKAGCGASLQWPLRVSAVASELSTMRSRVAKSLYFAKLGGCTPKIGIDVWPPWSGDMVKYPTVGEFGPTNSDWSGLSALGGVAGTQVP